MAPKKISEVNGIVAMYQEIGNIILSLPHLWCHRCHTHHSVINVLMTLVITRPHENIAALYHSLLLTIDDDVAKEPAG